MASKHALTGLKRLNNAPQILKTIYNKTLHMMEKLPQECVYRISTKQILCYRLSVLKDCKNVEEVENTINCGPIEMLISQAQSEYELCQNMIIWRPWEPLIECPPPSQWDWPFNEE